MQDTLTNVKDRPSGRLFRHHFQNPELLLISIFILGAIAIPITTIALFFALYYGIPHNLTPFEHHSSAFVDGPKHRGTLNLIWVCVSTIFTCVYLAVHIDVPDAEKAAQFRDHLKQKQANAAMAKRRIDAAFFWVLSRIWEYTEVSFCRRGLWMAYNIFAPELVVFTAILERISAASGVKYMHSRGQEEWNLTLAFFADMGGFQYKGAYVPSDDAELDAGHVDHVQHFPDGRSFLEWFNVLQKQTHSHDAVLKVEPLLAEINDRRNQDGLLKFFTCAQAAWLLIETCVRLVEKKDVSELEATTCTYIFCTVIAYVCWRHKPYNIEGRVTIRDEHIEFIDKKNLQPPTRSSWRTFKLYSKISTFEDTPLPEPLFADARFTPFNRSYLRPDRAWRLSCFVAALVGAVIGFIHGAMFWRYTFIFATGQWLWRISSILQIFAPFAIGMVTIIEIWYTGVPLFVSLFVLIFIYCASRIVLFALVCISFWNLPKNVYFDIDWSMQYVPHWH